MQEAPHPDQRIKHHYPDAGSQGIRNQRGLGVFSNLHVSDVYDEAHVKKPYFL
jgi:hypothetical protein